MELTAFERLPDHAQVWVFAFNRPLDSGDQEKLERELAGFLPSWNSHQAPVQGAFSVLHDRFAIVAGHCADGLSGCSMDSCVSNFKTLKARHGLDGLDRSLVFYRDREGRVQSCSRITFQQRLDSGEVQPDCTVFDTTLQQLGQLRDGAFELSFERAWHSRAFRAPVPRD